jgi:hypothetical protein
MPLQNSHFDYLLDTIEAICRSPSLTEYIIGITARPSERRRAYRDAVALRYPHFVILATNLTRDQAWDLERDLQEAIRSVPICYRKYHPDRRNSTHRRSAGGSEQYAQGNAYSVYVSWRGRK